uniref:Oxysterol-binding protein n=1 Tax=Steinernema glaseri TaxID=37863 RepID=A0A1I7ZDC3_9BILA
MTLKKRFRKFTNRLMCHRSQGEVGHSCRGSINLQEARIHTDSATHHIIVSGSSQTFHLKAQNELDRNAWLTALEYARHRAIKRADSDEDDDARAEGGIADHKEAITHSMQAITQKMDDLKKCGRVLNKQYMELGVLLEDMDSADRKKYTEQINMFKVATSAMLQCSDEFTEVSERETRRLKRFLTYEREQRLQLQDQIEQLARQHSHLERAAFADRTQSGSSQKAPPGLSGVDSDDEFHDANDDFDEVINVNESDGKSGSSRQPSVCESTNDEDAAYMTGALKTQAADAADLSNTDSSSNAISLSTPTAARKRRSAVPERPQVGLNLWSIMRNCIGKELSKIPMPVNFNEPLSVLQRITEDLEYAFLLDRAAEKTDTLEQMCYVAAYAVSSYSTTGSRTTKPFNPLLGETFECDRTDDLGWRSLTEQVSHHPPAAAHHAEGRNWTMHQDFSMKTTFRGKFLSVTPVGFTHVEIGRNHYSYQKITTTVHNIIVGKLWIDNHGDMLITNHTTGEKMTVKFHAYSYFSRDAPRRVSGMVKDSSGKVQWLMRGYWDSHLDIMKVTKHSNTGDDGEKSVVETSAPKRIWNVNPTYENSEKMYHFTKLAVELNEPEEGVAPTDSRLRPDQRLMEAGQWDEANKKKVELEEKQRAVRRKREAEAEMAMQNGEAYQEYEPKWFHQKQDELTGSIIHVFNGDYWKKKETGEWGASLDIF